MGGVHLVTLPQVHQPISPSVSSQARQVAHACASPSGSYGRVAGVTTKTLQIQGGLVQALTGCLIELDHRFTQGEDIPCFYKESHGAIPTGC